MPRNLSPLVSAALLVALPVVAEVKHADFTTTSDGQKVTVYTISGPHSEARFVTWGASLIEMTVPDRDGKLASVTLGFDEPGRYLQPHPFFGCVAGRFANRIALGKFTLDGKTYQLPTNNGPHHLHGGPGGFDKRNWTGEVLGTNGVRFTYESADGEEGYPGKLTATVTYTLTERDELRIDYVATTDKPTVVNLTNHTYWNLSGEPDVLGHELQINADKYTVVDAESIPTGELRAVAGSEFDFTKSKPIGRDIGAMANTPGGGFDHNWVVNAGAKGELVLAAVLHDPKSGRTMRVLSDQPGIQFYSGNYVNNIKGRGGKVYGKFAGLCLETQHFPDAPNRPEFASTVLRPGETYKTTTVYAFSAK
ncbi:MAG TPA: aldose epimerase family protein [Chthoniobacteraceae bacterium]|nr:aldose epimerase family protein [Chthoniobacteraceae bacterium]